MRKIYKVFIAILFVLTFALSIKAQNLFFTDVNESAIQLGNSKRVIVPQKLRSIGLNNQALRNFLWALPSEKNVANRNQTPVLELPTPDGGIAKFHVWESSIQEPGLAAKFPDIKTFTGQGIDDPYATIRLDYSPYGFHAQVLTIKGTYYIDPYARGMVDNYISYYRKDFTKTGTIFCEVPDNTVAVPPINSVTAQCLGTDLRTYRLAVACTGEYAQAPGIVSGTNPAILHAAIVTTVNRVVGVYEKEVAIRMILVANNNIVEYLDAATDPFTGNNNANVLINESQTVIDANIGSANYDIGHTFSTGGGGLAQLNSPCGSSKARGITGSPNPTGDAYDIDYVAHEIGHQFGGNHSMAGCGSSPTSTKYEVGSGTTIQAYAGICGAENIQPNSDPFFHPISFDEISNFVVSGGGSTCGTSTPTGNTLPVIDPLSNNNLTIPPGTPFTLTGAASDANGDPLTYCWEQWDFSGTATWNAGVTAAPNNTVPLFKSRIPKTTGSRTFPDMAVILANYPANPPSAMAGLKGETLSPVARTMKFRLTVRDNRAAGGGVVSSGSGCQGGGVFLVNVVGTTPFTVAAPNGGESWPASSTQTITWNTAGSENAPINVANVKISLSTDGGFTYPTVITASTANDGTEALTIPNITTAAARIKIEAVGNIFFDISNANFTITAPVAGFDFSNTITASVACASATSATVTLGTISNNGYVIPVNLTASGNPVGTTVSFSVNPVTPGNSTDVTLNNTNTLAAGSYNVLITGISGSITQTKTLTYTINPGAGPSITLQPAGQVVCEGAAVMFSIAAATATAFQWQVSTNGGVNFTSIPGATAATYSILSTFGSQNNYQYRCIATGQCNSTISAAAILTVNTPPSIANQPAASTICANQNTSFTVSATGIGLTYQWQVSTNGCASFSNLANAAPYSGVTSATLNIIGATTALNNNGYRCIVSGSCPPTTATTACVALTVNTPVNITNQPANLILCPGATATFNVTATGTSPTYQWQESINGGTTFSNLINTGIYAGATTAALTITGITTTMNNYQYRCIVSGAASCSALNSVNALLTLNIVPAITLQPAASSIICAAQNTSFTTAASGTALTYQWQLSTDGGTTYNNIVNGGVYSNVTTATLNITGAIVAMNTYKYRCVVSGTCAPSAATTAATLTVYTPVSVSANPVNSILCENSNGSFSVTAAGTSPTYQWQVSADGGTTFTNITNGGVYSGATTAVISLSGVSFVLNANLYRCIISGTAPCGAINSATGTLNINAAPTKFIVTGGGSYCVGSNGVAVGLSNSAIGINYQLQLNGVNNGTPLSGNGAALNFGNKTVAGNYAVFATNATTGCTQQMTGSVIVIVNPLPTLSLSVAPYKNLFPSLTTTLTATATTTAVPNTITYLWFKNNVAITNSGNTQTVSINNPIANLGDYKVTITDANGCVNQSQVITIADSANAKLFIYPSPNNGQFTVAYYNPGGTSTKQIVTIFSSRGQRVYKNEFPVSLAYQLLSIDLRKYSAGVYYVVLSDANGKKIKTGEVLVR